MTRRAKPRTYRLYKDYLRRRLGIAEPARKLCLDAGFTCPNIDGTRARGGCTYCNNDSFSPTVEGGRKSITQQWQEGTAYLAHRYGPGKYIAYFQPFTNTYGEPGYLKDLYLAALRQPDCVGLSIGTRPDCVPDPVLDMIDDLAREHFITLEFGIQTVNDKTLTAINRAHTYAEFEDAMDRAAGRRFDLCLHFIFGLPGEGRADVLNSAEASRRWKFQSVKLHNLHIVKNTQLNKQYQRGELTILDETTYVNWCADFLERLDPDVAIQRIVGDAPPDLLVAPRWCTDKARVYRLLAAELRRRKSWQGKLWQPDMKAVAACSA